MLVRHLKCNYLTNPLGVEAPSPLLSWVLQSDERGQLQTAYRIAAASDPDMLDEGKYNLWDTGKVESDSSIHIRYAGEQLTSMQACFWKVCVWGRDGKAFEWSETAVFEMGLLDKKDWKSQWICRTYKGTDISEPVPAPLFRKTVTLNKKVLKARAFICGLGYHELSVNGIKIGDEVLSPAFTRYDQTVMYNTCDITSAMKCGENAIGIILGNGWYNCFTSEVWDYRQAPWRHHPKLLFQAHITLEDGEEIVITSNKSWKTSTGPIVFDGLRNGEFYDARLEKPGWNEPGYDDSKWENALIAKAPGGSLKSFQMTPIKVAEVIRPVGLKEVQPGIWVFDLGRNISGWAKLKVSGPSGTEITLKYAEKVEKDGSIDQSNIDVFIKSGECQTDKYILKGGVTETWEPRFTYHGFQYVQMEGFPGTPTLENLCGHIVHTAFSTRGSFECSNELLNAIQKCARRSTLTNYHGIPTDCPHREKNSWTGDASLSAEQVLFNFDPMSAYWKWLQDFKDVQRPSGQLPGIVPTGGWGFNWGSGPAWDSALILIPWYLYLYCGDLYILEEMYDNMKRYLDFMTSMADEHIVSFGLGDWCPPVGEPDDYKCPAVVTDTAYYYIDAVTVSRIAALLGNTEDSEKYAVLANKIRDAFRRSFLNAETGIITGNCQTSMACALYQGLVNEEEKPKVMEKLVEQVEIQNRHIDCGILGAKYVMHTLTKLGRPDLSYAIATQATFPGWGHWISQGATTLWENWAGNSSRNHHMFSDISAWFYKGLAGINPDPQLPGFKHIIFRPNPVDGLEWVKCSHQSLYGLIECNWRTASGAFEADITIPVNCHGTLYLSDRYSGTITEGRKPVDANPYIKVCKDEYGRILLELDSGKYTLLSAKSKA